MSDTPAQATILDTPALTETTTPITPPAQVTPDAPAAALTTTTFDSPAPSTVTLPTPTPAAPTPPPAPDKDWRAIASGGDEKRLKQLERYSDLAAFANKTFSLEAKLSSGEYRRDLPKDATPEQEAEWRQERGLPAKAEDYKQNLPDGVVFGETDKPVIEDFQKFAYDNKLSNEVFNKTLSWYHSKQEAAAKQQEATDATYHEESKDVLMSEWGLKDYRSNLAAMAALRDQMPQGLADRVLAGRTADGKLIGDDPTFLRWFGALAREMNPNATVVGLDSGKTVEGELDAIRRTRRENPDKYDADKAMQARELELITAQQRMRK